MTWGISQLKKLVETISQDLGSAGYELNVLQQQVDEMSKHCAVSGWCPGMCFALWNCFTLCKSPQGTSGSKRQTTSNELGPGVGTSSLDNPAVDQPSQHRPSSVPEGLGYADIVKWEADITSPLNQLVSINKTKIQAEGHRWWFQETLFITGSRQEGCSLYPV